MKLFKKILIANRGEIAVRIMRTARKLGIATVGIYAGDDTQSWHVEYADEAFSLGTGSLQDTYLNINKIIDIAKQTNCDALHPGYGFLAENAQLVKAVQDAGMIFIGPDAEAMHVMGDKIRARALAEQAGVPISKGIVGSPGEILQQASEISFPVLVKASAGGGGKGMRIVHSPAELKEALEATSREAKNYFGDGTVYIEKFLEEPRHIEIQVLGDKQGNAVYLFERECSIQRRYQKIVEEAPSPTLSPELRKAMGEAAVKLVKKIKYSSAGTVEFLVDKNLNFYFLEMNTRIQVEHPVTEMITGKDLVEEQFYVAAGEPLRFSQDELHINGHAIECRIYAENPEQNFIPSPGKITSYQEPDADYIRVDAGINKPVEIKSQYDPMIAKLIVHGNDRNQALKRMNFALRHYTIQGIETNINYLIKLIEKQEFVENAISTKFCDLYTDAILDAVAEEQQKNRFLVAAAFFLHSIKNVKKSDNIWNEIGYWRQIMQPKVEVNGEELAFFFNFLANNTFECDLGMQKITLQLHSVSGNELHFAIDGRKRHILVSENIAGEAFVNFYGLTYRLKRKDRLFDQSDLSDSVDFSGANADGKIVSPMPGKVIKINVKEGDEVKKGDTLLIVEAMKMENSITCPRDGKIEKVLAQVGETVDGQKQLILLSE